MQTEAVISNGQDAEAVRAVRQGDAERYRELVERHERRVFAVAWSRLGDASLAEEAAQETFIRAYRRLWLLGDGAKFAGWIVSIARRVAINLGLRHRRELNKRARWALEQMDADSTITSSVVGESEANSPETLRQTLEELSAAHRECLVLFYVEGKSGAEAAAALGISESAFRVRLHRARGALREQLAVRLEGSLEKLRPGAALAGAIMAAILVPGTAKAAAVGGAAGAGLGAKLLSSLGQSTLFGWMMPFFGLIGMVPGLIAMGWVNRMERRNFREAGGFRGRLHRDLFRSFLWGFPVVMVLVIALSQGSMRVWGMQTHYLILCGFVLIPLLASARTLVINLSRFQVGMLCYSGVILAGLGASALGWLPPGLGMVPMMVATVLMMTLMKHRPARMDYSLFLRATQGMLPSVDDACEPAASIPVDRRAMIRFARFLGERWLVNNFRWETRGLALRLPPVKAKFAAQFLMLFSTVPPGCSSLALGQDGTVAAHCGEDDAVSLRALNSQSMPVRELEQAIARAVTQAWSRFRAGDTAAAERALGELPESEVFVVPPGRSRATRWLAWYMGATVAIMAMSVVVIHLMPQTFSKLQPARVTELEIRAALAAPPAQTNGLGTLDGDLGYALSSNFVLPPTHWISPENLARLRQLTFNATGFDVEGAESTRLSSLRFSWFLHAAMTGGWLSWKDIAVRPEAMAEYLRSLARAEPLILLGRREMTAGKEKVTVERIHQFSLSHLRWLRDIGCLDLVEREKWIKQLASVQARSAAAATNLPPIADWRRVRGLFVTPGWPALHDTYLHLAALELLGGLDRIDRETCIERILKLHRGAGFFAPPDVERKWELNIKGDAKDAFCAFESLRILGALDRVPDLVNWKFRPARASKPGVNDSLRAVTWEEIEAWICQDRLERMLRERQHNPAMLWRSLRQA